MPKSKKEIMQNMYRRRRAEGLVRIYLWIPEGTQQIVKAAVERAVEAWKGNKKRFWG